MTPTMRAIIATWSSDSDILAQFERLIAVPGGAFIKVAARAVNRPDLTQRRDGVPLPPGITTVLGLNVGRNA